MSEAQLAGVPQRGQVVLSVQNVTRTFRQGETTLRVFRNASMDVRAGELVALVGPSGAGKSCFLHIAGLLEAPDSGQVVICGQPAVGLPDWGKSLVRRERVGFVYQFHHLLPEFTALENVILPQVIAGRPRRPARERAVVLLERMGLGDRVEHYPAELSGGEQQRTAIARAMANAPGVLLADEPTGNLDPRTARKIYSQMVRFTRQHGVAMVIATHNLDLAVRMDRVLLLRGGRLLEGADLARRRR